jgi:hypothetical protein
MKRLIRNILIFLLPVFLLIVIIPVNKRLIYSGLINDCSNHGIWIYDRIHLNEKPIDIAFFGSSHTLNAVNDRLIEDSLKNMQLMVTNFGYCRLGNNLIYVFLKELVKTKKVKAMILEVREDENLFSHPIFPYITDSKDVLLSYPWFNKDQLKDIFIHFAYKTENIQKILFNRDSISNLNIENFGFLYSTDTASIFDLDAIKIDRNKPKLRQSSIQREFQMKYPRKYLEKIKNICDANNIKLYFLYIPAYGTPFFKPLEFDTYLKYGEVLLPPAEILEDKTNWTDINHLNLPGANKLSGWLAMKIRKFQSDTLNQN